MSPEWWKTFDNWLTRLCYRTIFGSQDPAHLIRTMDGRLIPLTESEVALSNSEKATDVNLFCITLLISELDLFKAIDAGSAVLEINSVENSIWSMDKFERGWEAERQLGGMMNNFPTIDKFDKVGNTISSIKSMDLGCKTYQSTSAIKRTIAGYVSKVANFKTGRYSKLIFNANAQTVRYLDLAIPPCATSAQMEAIRLATEKAKSSGVTVITHIIQ